MVVLQNYLLLAGVLLTSSSERVVEVLEGGTAVLPCTITGGQVYTVLWYRASQGQPFYTSVSLQIQLLLNNDPQV